MSPRLLQRQTQLPTEAALSVRSPSSSPGQVRFVLSGKASVLQYYNNIDKEHQIYVRV